MPGQTEGDQQSHFDLIRVSVRPEGAFGVLLEGGFPFAFTLERTYDLPAGGQRVKIQPGLWHCRSSYFYRGGYDTYEITGVPGYNRLLFHRGNLEDDSEGCILLGRRAGELNGRPAVLESGIAFEDFMRRTGGRFAFALLVRDVSLDSEVIS